VLSIDYDDMADWGIASFKSTGDLMKAYRRLSVNGFLGLGFSDDDFLSGPQSTTYILNRTGNIFRQSNRDGQRVKVR